MTRAGINDVIWAVSLALQCGLLVALVRRGVARRWRMFAVLLAFYSVRSVAVFALFRHVSAQRYGEMYSAFAVVDLLLQLAVAVEIAVHLLRGWRGAGRLLVALVPVLSLGGVLLMLQLLPEYGPIRPDRVQLFDSWALVLLGAIAFLRPGGRVLRGVVGGLAVYAASNLLVTVERTHAAMRRDVAAFNAWSYVTPMVYVAVLAAWLWLLKDDAAAGAKKRETAAVVS